MVIRIKTQREKSFRIVITAAVDTTGNRTTEYAQIHVPRHTYVRVSAEYLLERATRDHRIRTATAIHYAVPTVNTHSFATRYGEICTACKRRTAVIRTAENIYGFCAIGKRKICAAAYRVLMSASIYVMYPVVIGFVNAAIDRAANVQMRVARYFAAASTAKRPSVRTRKQRKIGTCHRRVVATTVNIYQIAERNVFSDRHLITVGVDFIVRRFVRINRDSHIFKSNVIVDIQRVERRRHVKRTARDRHRLIMRRPAANRNRIFERDRAAVRHRAQSLIQSRIRCGARACVLIASVCGNVHRGRFRGHVRCLCGQAHGEAQGKHRAKA